MLKVRTTVPFQSKFKMQEGAKKIRILNRILASRTEFGADFFEQSASAIDFASASGAQLCTSAEFAKSMLKIYDPSAVLEYVDISANHFEPLFILGEINAAVKRLAGAKNPILIVEGLGKSAMRGGKRWSQKKRVEYAQNLSTVEGIVLRYESCVSGLEIIFL